MSRGKLFPCSLANSLKYLQIYQCSLISRAEIKAHRGLTGSRRPGEAVVVGGDMEAVAAAAVDAFAAAAWPSSPPSPERFERLLLPSLLLLLLLCFLELLCFLGDEGAAPAIAVGDMLTLERMEKSEKNEELKRTENDRKKKLEGPVKLKLKIASSLSLSTPLPLCSLHARLRIPHTTMLSFVTAASSSSRVAAAAFRPATARRSSLALARSRSTVAARASSSSSSSGGLHFIEKREGEWMAHFGSSPAQAGLGSLSAALKQFEAEKQPNAHSCRPVALVFARRFFSLFQISRRLFSFAVSPPRPRPNTTQLTLTRSLTRSRVLSCTPQTPRAEDDGAVTFVFGDEAQAAAAAARSAVQHEEEENKAEAAAAAAAPPSNAAAAAGAALSEEAAFAALEAFSPVSHAPVAAFEAMEAFAASQKATEAPPTLPVVEEEEAAAAAAAAVVEEEVEEEISAPAFAVAEEIQEPAEELEEAVSQEAVAAAADEDEKEEEAPLDDGKLGAAAVSAQSIVAAAGLPHFDAAALKSMKVADLRKLAAERAVKGYSKMKKAEILSALLVLGEEK